MHIYFQYLNRSVLLAVSIEIDKKGKHYKKKIRLKKTTLN